MLYLRIFTGQSPSAYYTFLIDKKISLINPCYQTSRRGTEFRTGGRTESNAEMLVGIEAIFSLLIFFYYRNYITP